MIVFSVSRTMEYLRIIDSFSHIVTMMFSVLMEMGDFLIFLVIVCFFLSMIPAILQFGNYDHKGKTASPYEFLNMNVANLILILRFAMADFDNIGFIETLSDNENRAFWILWVLIVILTAIIFMNFVISKATYTYDRISERLNEYILKDKTQMIGEADLMKPRFLRNYDNYPKYFIIRKSPSVALS